MLIESVLEADIDDEGICESYGMIETRYARCEAIANVPHEGGDGYVSVISDYQDCMIETRIQYDTLKASGWTPPAAP